MSPEGYPHGEPVFRRDVPPPDALERVIEQKKPDFLRKLEIQTQVMNHLGYRVNVVEPSEETPEIVEQNNQSIREWEVAGLAAAFNNEWNTSKVQGLLEKNASDDDIASPIDVTLNELVPSAELKKLYFTLWPNVEVDLKSRLHVDDNKVRLFSLLKDQWQQSFRKYLTQRVAEGSIPASLESMQSDVVNFIIDNTENYLQELNQNKD